MWVRQLLLLLVGVGLESTIDAARVGGGATVGARAAAAAATVHTRAAARYGWAGAALAVIAGTAYAQERVQPYALRVQNTLARWMYLSNALLLMLGAGFTALVQHEESGGAVQLGVEAALIVLVLADIFIGVGVGVFVLVREGRRHLPTADADLSDVLLRAIEPIDAPLRERLLDGSVRLLRAAWLVEVPVRLARRQELPDEAFVEYEAAAQLLDRGDRSVLVLSHGWMTPTHPDPLGASLAAVQRHLRENPHASHGVFIVRAPELGVGVEGRGGG